MGKVFNRYFYALSSMKVIEDVTNSCNTCLALRKAPNELFEQSSSSPPSHPGSSLAADVICRAGQKILVVRDTLTSFTAATFIQNETASEYRDAIMLCTLPMKAEVSEVRVDCAPGLKSLERDIGLKSAGIKLDFGRVKNKNKNPVAEKANQELEIEILKLDPSGKPISAITLTKAVCVLNSRIRHMGLSAKEMFFGRDQISGERLDFTDNLLGESQSHLRKQNHLSSAKSKAKGGNRPPSSDISVGSVVFLKQEGSKFKSRESYIVTDVLNTDTVVVQKMDSGKGYFGSVRYEVPIDRLFLCSIGGKQNHRLYSDNSDLNPIDDNLAASSLKNRNLISSESDSDDTVHDVVIPQEQISQPELIEVRPQRSSSRIRRRPNRYGSVDYDADSPFQGESDTVADWWPNYPRGTWSPDVNDS